MIISHCHKFIFFAVPKCATHAIRQALAPLLAAGDWEQQDLFAKRRIPIPAIARLQHGHVSVNQLRPHLTDQQWRSYYKFAFVRNPFDRYVSTCFFLNRNNPQFENQAVGFMKQAIHRPRFRQRILARPQSEILTDSTGNIALDLVGRYESLQADFDFVCRQVGLDSVGLERKNASKHKPYAAYYDDELRTAVNHVYQDDLTRFDYGFEGNDDSN